jgi:hypothetical protein
MNEIELAVHRALESQGDTEDANQAYLAFMKANFFIPIEKETFSDDPKVLFFSTDHQVFLPIFSRREYLDAWAKDIQNEIAILHLTGVNLLNGVEDQVTLCFNIGTPLYKEFNPGELARMRSMLIKIGLIEG